MLTRTSTSKLFASLEDNKEHDTVFNLKDPLAHIPVGRFVVATTGSEFVFCRDTMEYHAVLGSKSL